MGSIKVTILLATYNGARFLREQLKSIIHQTHTDWELLISDDASSDETISVLNDYAGLYQQKIRILPPAENNLGSVTNFGRLFTAAKSAGAAYIMFCDQDDCWLPFKIELTLQRMLAEEFKKSPASPLLIHTNFTYVDSNLQPIPAKSKFSAQKLKHLSLANLIIQNPVYGCTSMFNKALSDKIFSIPPYAENHDFWVALVASAFGEIIYIPETSMLYRQHRGNISTQHDNDRMIKRIKRVFHEKRNVSDLELKKVMIAGFERTYKDELSQQQHELIKDFLAFLNKHQPALAIANLRRGVRMQTAGQTLLFYLTAMLHR